MTLFDDVPPKRTTDNFLIVHWTEIKALADLQMAYDYARHRADFLRSIVAQLPPDSFSTELVNAATFASSDADFYRQAVSLRLKRGTGE